MDSHAPIEPARVRYIKLGRHGQWERESLAGGIARFGYETADPDRLAKARAGRWQELRADLLSEGRTPGGATGVQRTIRTFFTDGPDTLWITLSGQRLWWAFLEPGAPEPHADAGGTFRRVRGGWRSDDLRGGQLTFDRLAGTVTKSAGFRGTMFTLGPDEAAYVVRRINGGSPPEVERAHAALAELRDSAQALIARLGPRDFELLVDLVFSASGWRRIGRVGGPQKTLDLDVVLPSTGERAFIQVKSRATDRELEEYLEQLDDHGQYARMFFVHHSGHVAGPEDPRVVVVGPERLAGLVVDAGLVGWLIAKVG